eukprot:CAMPEP_0204560218 /NCGR_PEP_ID=MMETSP0661-20131031/32485_1 /ASSEMBLY_ACC=CAM_ASM_000606 /TAXON_ID=109239 /ORGANISM="Alexandrium margalefi, Strain AMGDE01CS-322" /LENGTH=274 /DNA_ID=CAMNT_0051567525 /DNA_START=51 /DNA_END=875 /DNA_ORIENTATION=+
MVRSTGRSVAVAVLGAAGYLVVSQIEAFVAPAQLNSTTGRHLSSRVKLAATQSDVDAAKKEFELKQWAASTLASQGSPQSAAAATRAQQAEAAYSALKAQVDGQAPAAVPAAVPTPVAAMPVATPPPASVVSKEDLAAAKHNAQLLTWAASKLASEGAPQAASMKVKADTAVAAFEALRQAQGAAPAAAAAPVAPAVSIPVASPSVAAQVASSSSGPSDEDVAKAKADMELHEWAASTLASKGSLVAAAMQDKAAQSRQTYEALVAQQKQLLAR